MNTHLRKALSAGLLVALLPLSRASAGEPGWTNGKVVGVDVFDSQRARFTVRGNGDRAFWIMLETSTGKTMMAAVMMAAAQGNPVKVFHFNNEESFGGQGGTVPAIVFQETGN